MKIMKYLLGLSLVLTMQSCFQDFKEPAFNYPESKPAPSMDNSVPEKVKISFNSGKIEDEGYYQFTISAVGDGSVVNGGITDKAYKGATDSYFLMLPHVEIQEEMIDTISGFKNLSLSLWMKSTPNKAATGIFSIPNTKEFWGNFDVFLDNNNSSTEAFFKVHIFNNVKGKGEERWAEVRIPNFFTDTWQHLVFSYDSAKSKLTVWHNASNIFESVYEDYGELNFKDIGSLLMGTLQFQTIPSQTSASEKQDWAGFYEGMLDNIHLYNEPLSQEDVKYIFNNKL